MAAHQASPSLRFSRQEQWSGLPLPSPMHKSEKWKWSHSVVSDSQRPHGLQPTRLLHPWIFQARVLEWGAIAFSDGGSKLFSFSKNLKKNKRPYKWTYLQNRNGCTGLENKFLVTKGKGREKVLAAQSYPTLCHPLDCSPPGSSVLGIL